MKKTLLLTAIAFATFFNSQIFAQTTQFGFRAGLNVSSLSGDDAENLESRTGFHVGILYNYVYTDKIAVEAGATYSVKGATGESDSLEIELGYIEWHAMFKYYLTSEIDLHAGPQIGFLVTSSDGADNDLTEFLRPLDFGLRFGAGYTLDFGLGVAVHYYAGLRNIGAEVIEYSGITETTTQLDLKNNNLSVSLQYLF